MNTNWKFNVETVTPDVAKKLLETNTGNRHLRGKTVERYAAIMKTGGWLLTPEPIIVGTTGRLLNGQHRLNAVIQCGSAQRMLIVRNVDESTFPALDRGAVRTFADANGMDRGLSEVAKLLTTLVDGQIPALVDKRVLANAQLLEQNFRDLMSACPSNKQYFSSAPFRLAACVHMFNPANRDHAVQMYSNFVYGHVNKLPPIGQSLVGAYFSGRVGRNTGGHEVRRESVLRAFSVFNIDNAEATRLPPLSGKNGIDGFTGTILGIRDAKD